MNFDLPTAFAPFFDAVAEVSGVRREAGASTPRTTALYLPCCVLGGDSADPNTGASAAPAVQEHVVIVRRSDWPDHLPPQIGDRVRIDGYQDMRIYATPYLDGGVGWAMPCRSQEAAL